MTAVTIYHNPRCSKSRQTLALLQERDLEIEIIEYLKNPPNAATIRKLAKQLGVAPHDLLRQKEYRELGLEQTEDSDELVRQIAENPTVLQRPIVVCGRQARVGRPPENVLEIL